MCGAGWGCGCFEVVCERVFAGGGGEMVIGFVIGSYVLGICKRGEEKSDIKVFYKGIDLIIVGRKVNF